MRTAPEVRQDPDNRRVRLVDGAARRLGVRTARVERRPLSPTIELVGSVDFDAERVADIGGRIPGRVARLLVALGAEVREGQALAEIESAALGDAYADYLSARANAEAAHARLRREMELARQQLTTAPALEEARAAAAQYDAQVRGARQRLAAMGAGSDGAQRVILRAPIAGRVIRRDVVLGQTIEETDRLMRIADLSSVWVLLDVFERDLGRVRVGDHVEITSETYPGRTFTGTVGYIDATVDTTTRTARVRVVVQNPDLLLRQGQFVTARLRTSAEGVREAITVPRDAVVQIEGHPAVFVSIGPGEFEARSVVLGVRDGDALEVRRGLDAGDEIVVEGAFALKSELQR